MPLSALEAVLYSKEAIIEKLLFKIHRPLHEKHRHKGSVNSGCKVNIIFQIPPTFILILPHESKRIICH